MSGLPLEPGEPSKILGHQEEKSDDPNSGPGAASVSPRPRFRSKCCRRPGVKEGASLHTPTWGCINLGVTVGSKAFWGGGAAGTASQGNWQGSVAVSATNAR